jgi:sugar transferase (PEP-CTERM/EpsH1 system associated)
MSNVLFLAHRLPYPPHKGDKVRSYHLLRHLAARHRVYLGTFIDDPEDEHYVEKVRSMCAGLHVAGLRSHAARWRSLQGLATGSPLTLHYYQDAGLKRWVRELASQHALDASVVFSSSMAQYAVDLRGVPMLVDFVDVDSAKWTAYAPAHRWPLGPLYAREGRELLAYERGVALQSRRSFFVTEREAALFRGLAPECAERVDVMGNGVDGEYFSPSPARASPFEEDETALVFTGSMDYWPNIDAVTWFVQEILPRVRESWPRVRFHIVGRAPSDAVHALASDAVRVTGGVPDIRPYLQHAGAVVAPLRLARGIQNKILEAMAMGRPVVASDACMAGIDAQAGNELLVASTAEDFAARIDELLRQPACAAAVGAAARTKVVQRYSWDAHLAVIDPYLEIDQPCEAVEP